MPLIFSGRKTCLRESRGTIAHTTPPTSTTVGEMTRNVMPATKSVDGRCSFTPLKTFVTSDPQSTNNAAHPPRTTHPQLAPPSSHSFYPRHIFLIQHLLVWDFYRLFLPPIFVTFQRIPCEVVNFGKLCITHTQTLRLLKEVMGGGGRERGRLL